MTCTNSSDTLCIEEISLEPSRGDKLGKLAARRLAPNVLAGLEKAVG